CYAGENNEIDFAFAKTLNKNDFKVNGGSGDDTTPPEEDIVCDAGYYLDGTECQLCAAGTYAAAGANSCTTCPANTYSSAGAAACTDCPTGTTAPAGSTSAAACEGDPNCNTDPTKAIDEDHFCNAKCTSGCRGYGLNCYQLGKGSCPYLCKDGFCYTDCSDRGDYEVCDSGNVGKLEHCEYRDGWYNPLFVIDDDIYMYRTSTPHITACVCFTGDTLIQLANGTMKRADAVTYDDELLVWNFDEGHFDTAKPLWIKIPEMTTSYNYLKFSDGSILKTINHHRIFNREAGKFTYPMTDDTPIGTTTLNARGEWVTLVEQRVVEEEVTYYNIITEHHINCFAGNILTSCRLNNIYPIRDLKFVKDNRVLTPYTAFAELPKKWYDGLRLAEQPEEINRGKNDSIRGKNLIEYVQRLIERTQEPEQSVLAA
ncbi:MAG: hypothetical protein IJV07_05015, partial [Alphaproteobacteria bacterium]|nr:hypothetical protein [Alphaproteobacteria bacterium]